MTIRIVVKYEIQTEVAFSKYMCGRNVSTTDAL